MRYIVEGFGKNKAGDSLLWHTKGPFDSIEKAREVARHLIEFSNCTKAQILDNAGRSRGKPVEWFDMRAYAQAWPDPAPGLPYSGIPMRARWFIAKKNPLPVAIAPIIDVKGWRVLLIDRKDSGLPGLTGGYIVGGETPAQAAAREVKEEAGLEVFHGDFGEPRVYQGASTILLSMPLEGIQSKPESFEDGFRSVEGTTRWVSIGEAQSPAFKFAFDVHRKILNGAIAHLKSIGKL